MCVVILQLTPPGPPQTQNLPPRFTAFRDATIFATVTCPYAYVTGYRVRAKEIRKFIDHLTQL